MLIVLFLLVRSVLPSERASLLIIFSNFMANGDHRKLLYYAINRYCCKKEIKDDTSPR